MQDIFNFNQIVGLFFYGTLIALVIDIFLILFVKNKNEVFLSILIIISGLMFIFAPLFNDEAVDFKYRFLHNLPFLIAGLIFIIAGVKQFLSFKDVSLRPDKGELIKSKSQKISADILSIKHLANIRVNGRAPYLIIAKGFNPIINQEQIFQSYHIWDDILFLIKNKKNIDIYIDTTNPKRYYMDVNSLINNN